MASTNKTTNYELSQFQSTDIPGWLTDYNGDMQKIDAGIRAAKVLADGATSGVSALQTAVSGKQDTLTFDSTPLRDSNNPVTSGGIYNALQNVSVQTDAVPTEGSTKAVQSGGVYTALQSKQNTLEFDSMPISGSLNPVTSNGVYNAINEVTDDIEHNIMLIQLQADPSNPTPISETANTDITLPIPLSSGKKYAIKFTNYGISNPAHSTALAPIVVEVQFRRNNGSAGDWLTIQTSQTNDNTVFPLWNTTELAPDYKLSRVVGNIAEYKNGEWNQDFKSLCSIRGGVYYDGLGATAIRVRQIYNANEPHYCFGLKVSYVEVK